LLSHATEFSALSNTCFHRAFFSPCIFFTLRFLPWNAKGARGFYLRSSEPPPSEKHAPTSKEAENGPSLRVARAAFARLEATEPYEAPEGSILVQVLSAISQEESP
jgi:hypothetical protein